MKSMKIMRLENLALYSNPTSSSCTVSRLLSPLTPQSAMDDQVRQVKEGKELATLERIPLPSVTPPANLVCITVFYLEDVCYCVWWL